MNWEQEAAVMSDGPSPDELHAEAAQLEDELRDRYDEWIDVSVERYGDGRFDIYVGVGDGPGSQRDTFGSFADAENWVDELFGGKLDA